MFFDVLLGGKASDELAGVRLELPAVQAEHGQQPQRLQVTARRDMKNKHVKRPANGWTRRASCSFIDFLLLHPFIISFLLFCRSSDDLLRFSVSIFLLLSFDFFVLFVFLCTYFVRLLVRPCFVLFICSFCCFVLFCLVDDSAAVKYCFFCVCFCVY